MTKGSPRHKHVMTRWGGERICKICRMTDYEIQERAKNARKNAARATAERQRKIREMQEAGIWPGLSGKIETRERAKDEENISAKSLDKEFPF